MPADPDPHTDSDPGPDADTEIGADEAAATAPVTFDWVTFEPDEEVLWHDKPHFYSIVPALIVGVPLSIVIIGIPIVLGAWLSRENTEYVLTSEALYKKTGILSRDVKRIAFDKVQNSSFTQDFLGRQFGYGHVDISTAGSSGTEMRFRSVADPRAVQERINRRIRRARSGATGEAGEGGEPAVVLDEILAELRAIRGALEADGVDVPSASGKGSESKSSGNRGEPGE